MIEGMRTSLVKSGPQQSLPQDLLTKTHRCLLLGCRVELHDLLNESRHLVSVRWTQIAQVSCIAIDNWRCHGVNKSVAATMPCRRCTTKAGDLCPSSCRMNQQL